MRFLLVAGVALFAGLAARGEDSSDRLYDFATAATYHVGRLDLDLYDYSQMWLNGHHLSQDELDLQLKPGDVVEGFVGGDFSRDVRVRLERLTKERADLMVWTYSGVTQRLESGALSHSRGRLLGSYRLVIDLTKPNFELVDYTNYVEAGPASTARSKPLQ